MAAVVQIHEMTGIDTGDDKTDDTIRFKSADETTVDSTNRLQIPGAGTDYSYTKQARAWIDSAPDTDLTNLQAYSDGTNNFGTGVDVDYDLSDTWTTQTDATIAGTDLFTKTAGAAINMDNTNDASGKTDTGYYGDYLRLQMKVASTASPGTLSAEVLTFSYDET